MKTRFSPCFLAAFLLPPELYELQIDPDKTKNLAAKHEYAAAVKTNKTTLQDRLEVSAPNPKTRQNNEQSR